MQPARLGGCTTDTVAERHHRRVRRQAGEQVGLVRLREEHHPAALDQRGEVAALERRAEQPQVGLEDAEDRLAAGALEQRVDVIAEAEAVDVERRAARRRLAASTSCSRLLQRLVPAVQEQRAGRPAARTATVGGPDFDGCTGYGSAGCSASTRAGEVGVERPQRREVAQQRRVVREDVASGDVAGCGHRLLPGTFVGHAFVGCARARRLARAPPHGSVTRPLSDPPARRVESK